MFGLSDKRPREDDDEDAAILDLNGSLTRERKKSRPLPFRTLSNSNNNLQNSEFTSEYRSRCPPSILTPTTDLTDEDDDYNSFDKKNVNNNTACGGLRSMHGLRPPPLNMDNAMDLDDTCEDALPLYDNDIMSSWSVNADIHHNGGVRPSPIPHGLVNRSLNINEGHIATSPVYDHLTMNNVNMPAGMITGSSESMSADNGDLSCSSLKAENHEETNGWGHRPFPSPISEDEYTLESGGNINYDNNNNGFSAANKPRWMTNAREESGQFVGKAMKSGSSSSSSKGKMTLSMGFRADCDKCQRKVIGHYSHIISS